MDKDYTFDVTMQEEKEKEEAPAKKFHLFGSNTVKEKKEQAEKPKDNRSFIQKVGIQNLCILLVLGILLIFLCCQDLFTKKSGSGKSGGKQTVASQSLETNPIYTETEQKTDEFVASLEEKLKKNLSKVQGVGECYVMINVSESKELVPLKDEPYTQESVNEEDAQGGTRITSNSTHEESTVMGTAQDGTTSPYIIKEIQPEIDGVVIIAEGGGNGRVQTLITEAVEALYDVPVHKIKVLPLQSKK